MCRTRHILIMNSKETSGECGYEGSRGRSKTRELRESIWRKMACVGLSQAWTIGICLCGDDGRTQLASDCKRASLGATLAQKHE